MKWRMDRLDFKRAKLGFQKLQIIKQGLKISFVFSYIFSTLVNSNHVEFMFFFLLKDTFQRVFKRMVCSHTFVLLHMMSFTQQKMV